jgi:hypothetical protein
MPLGGRSRGGSDAGGFGFMGGLAFGEDDLLEPYDFKGLKYRGVARERLGRRLRYGEWLNTLFPPLPDTPGQPPEPTWPAAARDLARSLMRALPRAKLQGGLAIVRQSETFDPRWGDVTSRSRRLELAAATLWLTRSERDGDQALVSWCDGKQVGIFSRAFQLGRTRSAAPRDVQPPPLELSDHSLTSLDTTYASYTPALEPRGKDRTLLILKHPSSPVDETRFLIDTARHVILSIEARHRDKVTSTTKFDDFVEVAGSWWARRLEATNEDGKRVTLITQTVQALPQQEFDQKMQTELAGRAAVQLVHLPLTGVTEAKKALAGGKATFDSNWCCCCTSTAPSSGRGRSITCSRPRRSPRANRACAGCARPCCAKAGATTSCGSATRKTRPASPKGPTMPTS